MSLIGRRNSNISAGLKLLEAILSMIYLSSFVVWCSLVATNLSMAQNLQKLTMGALGDSISGGFNAERPFYQRDKNWADGINIESHANLLRKLGNLEVISKNVSVSGAVTSDITNQTNLLLQNGFRPDYVTILIGANDICLGSRKPDELALYSKGVLEDSIRKIIEVNPKVKILISAVPNLNHLYSLMNVDPVCVENWRSLNICEKLLLSTKFEREKGVYRWNAYNKMLSEFPSRYPANVKFSSILIGNDLTTIDVSRVDCFHPSVVGQAEISRLTWEEGWFK